LRILDLDQSILLQEALLENYQANIIGLKDLQQRARLWSDKKTTEALEKRISGSERSAVTFLGSGDFHHLSSLLIKQFSESLCLIVFDFHPDWDIFSPCLSCGSWVNRAMKARGILKCLLLGVSSKDISSPAIEGGDFSLLERDRLEIYPWQHKPSRVYLRNIPHNVSLEVRDYLFFRRIYWKELSNLDIKLLFDRIFKRLPVNRVYLSIDKDCLRQEYALTNWEEGMLSLECLLFLIRMIRENLEIVGVDITGEYSPITIPAGFKRLTSYLDHPHKNQADTLPLSLINRRNEETNLKILEALGIQKKGLV